MDSVCEQGLGSLQLRMADRFAVGVVIASGGYPGPYEKGKTVQGLPEKPVKNLHVFHASTVKNRDGQVLTGGGRCFTVVGAAREFRDARQLAYEHTERIEFTGSWYRKDIGDKFLF
jgi:phosphoribosylamine-glycine ligase